MESETKRYETVVVFGPELSESGIKDECKKLEQVITAAGGRDIQTNSWGKKEMTYRVHGSRHGSFVALTYCGESSSLVDTLNKTLRISDPVLKFQTHRLSDRRQSKTKELGRFG